MVNDNQLNQGYFAEQNRKSHDEVPEPVVKFHFLPSLGHSFHIWDAGSIRKKLIVKKKRNSFSLHNNFCIIYYCSSIAV